MDLVTSRGACRRPWLSRRVHQIGGSRRTGVLPRQWLPPGAHARPPARFGRASKSSSTEIRGPTLLVGRGLKIIRRDRGCREVCTTPAGALAWRAASGARCSQGPAPSPAWKTNRVVPWRGCAAELAHVDALDRPPRHIPVRCDRARGHARDCRPPRAKRNLIGALRHARR